MHSLGARTGRPPLESPNGSPLARRRSSWASPSRRSGSGRTRAACRRSTRPAAIDATAAATSRVRRPLGPGREGRRAVRARRRRRRAVCASTCASTSRSRATGSARPRAPSRRSCDRQPGARARAARRRHAGRRRLADAAEAARSTTGSIPVIMFSGQVDERSAAEAEQPAPAASSASRSTRRSCSRAPSSWYRSNHRDTVLSLGRSSRVSVAPGRAGRDGAGRGRRFASVDARAPPTSGPRDGFARPGGRASHLARLALRRRPAAFVDTVAVGLTSGMPVHNSKGDPTTDSDTPASICSGATADSFEAPSLSDRATCSFASPSWRSTLLRPPARTSRRRRRARRHAAAIEEPAARGGMVRLRPVSTYLDPCKAPTSTSTPTTPRCRRPAARGGDPTASGAPETA